jgi:hypothetical protein
MAVRWPDSSSGLSGFEVQAAHIWGNLSISEIIGIHFFWRRKEQDFNADCMGRFCKMHILLIFK